MRVSEINNNSTIGLNFGRKKPPKNNNNINTQKSGNNSATNPNDGKAAGYGSGGYYPSFLIYTSNDAGGAQVHESKPYFDIKKIAALTCPNKPDVPPLPFEESHGKYTLDKYQKEAIEAFKNGNTTIVTAPTGTGKTLIAEYAIKDALDKGKKIIYLSPLKALSNEKYSDFSKLFGTYDKDGNLINTDNVGLLTGDTSINPSAPVLVMTTEIYRNSLLANDKRVADVNYKDYSGVIYDEFHYMTEPERGTVWEEAVMYTPEHMQQLMLSATASNAFDIAEWIQEINGQIPVHLVNVPESERYVPLREYILTEDKRGHELSLESVKTNKLDLYQLTNKINFSDRQIEAQEEVKGILGLSSDEEFNAYLKSLAGRRNTINSEVLATELEARGTDPDKSAALALILSNKGSTTVKKEPDGEYANHVRYSQVIKLLHEKQMDPVLFYVFSKKGCNFEMEKAAEHSPSLLTPEESKKVYDEVQKAKEKGVFLGSDFDDKQLEYLMKGFAVHHAGKLPAYKSFVENLARQGLVKACFATETLIAGINMPFKTTAFTSMEKFNGSEMADITTAAFKQGSGRAGRRGKDEIGNVVIIPYSEIEYEKYVEKTKSANTSIKSRYNPSYASILSERTLNDTDDTLLRTFCARESGCDLERKENLVKNRQDLLEAFGYIVKDENGVYQRTEKGDMAKNVFGINEIIMTELLTNPNYLKGMTSTELIAICSMFSDTKDENPSREFMGNLSYMDRSAAPIFDLADEVDRFEMYYNIKETPTPISTSLSPFITEFASLPDNREEAIEGWCKLMNKMRDKELLYHDGDFLRVINGTIDILKLVCELSPDENVRKEAKTAMEQLRKPPVVDIFNYELRNEEKTED